MMELRQMLWNLTTALAMMASRMDQLQASSVDITSAQPAAAALSAQPGTRAGGNSTAASSQIALVSAQPGGTTTFSAFAESDMEQNIHSRVKHRVSTAHHPA